MTPKPLSSCSCLCGSSVNDSGFGKVHHPRQIRPLPTASSPTTAQKEEPSPLLQTYSITKMRVSTLARYSFLSSLFSWTTGFAPTRIQHQQRSSTTQWLAAIPKVFIDGEAGTTGLQVRERLAERKDIQVISAPDELRKDAATRKALVNEADAVILCLPDDASIEAASWVENDRTVLIDASTAFRVDDDWVYGFPELSTDQRKALQSTKRISNPGCYPTGFISLTRPLTDAGLLPKGTPLTVNAISGYSGGGKALMGIYESSDDHEPWGTYGLSLQHKHVPEMSKYSGLGTAPIFQPAVANFAQGMVVSVPIHYAWMAPGVTGEKMHAAYKEHYAGSAFIEVMPLGESAIKEAHLERGAFLAADTLKDTNKLQIFVFANDEQGQALLVARLDNLGKGASGAAVQNMNIALGLEETAGLL